MNTRYTLREMKPDDGPAIALLDEQTPDSGAVAFQTRFHFDPFATITSLMPGVQGVVSEVPGQPGIVGQGMMSTGTCHYQGTDAPFAYLFGIGAHPSYRRRGMATQIYQWLVQHAKEEYGEGVVIFANIQHGNEGSLKAAGAWCTQVIDGRTRVVIGRMRSKPPRSIDGLTVAMAGESDWEEISQKQNDFYADFNLYPPRTAQGLHAWHTAKPFGHALHEYYIVRDSSRNILAGLSLSDSGSIVSSKIVRMPRSMQLANRVLKIVPRDGTMRRAHGKDFWYQPGRIQAGTYLWDSMRWLWRERVTTLMMFIDRESPASPAIARSRLLPASTNYTVLAGPKPMDEDRIIYMHT